MCAYDIGQSSILEVVGRKFQTSDDLQGPAYVAHGRRREGERDEVLRTPSSAQKNLGALEAAAKKAAGESREKTQMYVQRYIGRFSAAEKSSFSTVAGTTAPASKTSWDLSAPRTSSAFSSLSGNREIHHRRFSATNFRPRNEA